MWFLHHPRPISFINAQVVDENGIVATCLRMQKGLIAGLGESPHPQDVQVNLSGAYIFPGLINAHDHLELNHYGSIKFREKYENASEWTEDVSSRLNTDVNLMNGKSKPLSDRLFIGGLKNLLSGVTTVAHHNPFYREFQKSFPVRVVRDYGWAHSLYLQNGRAGADGEQAGNVVERYKATSKNFPFIIHLAEGTDEIARNEFPILKNLGCVDSNIVLVHGIGLSVDDWISLTQLSGGLIWCPTSNIFLIGKTIPARQLLDLGYLGHLTLGTDSRLTGSRDLLDEMGQALNIEKVTAKEVFSMVTKNAAKLLRLSNAGTLSIGSPADLLILPAVHEDPFKTLTACSRKDILLVTINGQPRYASPELAEVFNACKTKTTSVQVDGINKLLGEPWGTQLKNCVIPEAGVICLKN